MSNTSRIKNTYILPPNSTNFKYYPQAYLLLFENLAFLNTLIYINFKAISLHIDNS